MTDYETDLKLGSEYSIEAAQENIAAVEEHLGKVLYDSKYRGLCQGCLRLHSRLIRDKGKDCVDKFACPPDKAIWEKLYKWTGKLQRSIPEIGNNPLTKKLKDEARAFRKVIDREWEPKRLDDVLELEEEEHIREEGEHII